MAYGHKMSPPYKMHYLSQKQEPSAPERGGKLPAAFRRPLQHPQGGIHYPVPFAVTHCPSHFPLSTPNPLFLEFGNDQQMQRIPCTGDGKSQ